MKKLWHDKGWQEYLQWQSRDKKTIKRINELLRDIERDHFNGIGKPEPLKHNLQGYWSRRINDFDRLIYRITDECLEIVSCRSHYEE